MKNNLRKTLLTIVGLSVTAILLTGCGKKNKLPFDFDYLAVQMSKGDSWSIIDKNGKEVVKEEYPADARLSRVYEGTYWVYFNEKYQLYNIDNPKKPIVDNEFATATDFHSGVAVVGNPNQQIRIINTDGKIVATLGKDIRLCYAFNDEGYAAIINTDNKHGLIDTKGNIVITPTYACLYTPSDGLVIALKEDGDTKALILDMKGKKKGEINRDKYYLLYNGFREGKIAVRNAGDTDAHTVILDDTGKKLFDIKKAKDGFRSAAYWGGYMPFSNGEAIGVVDDKGEIIIRPKYKEIRNLANGYFFVRKDEKWGVVNADDETVVDFDYKDGVGAMGDNFLMLDVNSYLLIDKNGKEITSFAEASFHANEYAEYVDVTGLTNAAYNHISHYEQGFTPQQLAKELSLSMDDYHYKSYIGSKFSADGKMSIELSSRYESYVVEEQTHQEEFSDGWFTQTRTVSDGWNWSTETPNRISGTITLEDSSINLKDFYKALLEKMTEGRSKVSDNVFTKNIKVNGSTVECRTTLEQNYSTIGIEIVFRQ